MGNLHTVLQKMVHLIHCLDRGLSHCKQWCQFTIWKSGWKKKPNAGLCCRFWWVLFPLIGELLRHVPVKIQKDAPAWCGAEKLQIWIWIEKNNLPEWECRSINGESNYKCQTKPCDAVCMSSPQRNVLAHKNRWNHPALSRCNALHFVVQLDLCDVGFQKGRNRHGLSLSNRPEVHMI